jgi:hypothetical protein
MKHVRGLGCRPRLKLGTGDGIRRPVGSVVAGRSGMRCALGKGRVQDLLSLDAGCGQGDLNDQEVSERRDRAG